MKLRIAQHSDVPALSHLIEYSGRKLSAGFYSAEQADAIVRHVFGVDRQLIDDGTYFMIEHSGGVAACGGWSRRRTLFGADRLRNIPDPLLDPQIDPARIRAFFVHPSMARRGLGRQLMAACSAAAKQASFTALELVATLPGEPFYLAFGFEMLERFELHLPGGIDVPVSRMRSAV